MKHMKSLAALTAALMLAFSLAGCGMNTAASTASKEAAGQSAQNSQAGTETAQTTLKPETPTQGTASQPAEEKAMGIMGKVTAIDDKTITLNLAQAMTPPAGDKPAEGSSKIMTMALTGKEKTFNLSGQVHVTKGMGDKQEAIELLQITAGSIVMLQTEINADGQETVNAVSLLG